MGVEQTAQPGAAELRLSEPLLGDKETQIEKKKESNEILPVRVRYCSKCK